MSDTELPDLPFVSVLRQKPDRPADDSEWPADRVCGGAEEAAAVGHGPVRGGGRGSRGGRGSKGGRGSRGGRGRGRETTDITTGECGEDNSERGGGVRRARVTRGRNVNREEVIQAKARKVLEMHKTRNVFKPLTNLVDILKPRQLSTFRQSSFNELKDRSAAAPIDSSLPPTNRNTATSDSSPSIASSMTATSDSSLPPTSSRTALSSDSSLHPSSSPVPASKAAIRQQERAR